MVLLAQEVVVLRMWSCWRSGGRCLEDVVLLAQEVVVLKMWLCWLRRPAGVLRMWLCWLRRSVP